MRIGRAATSRDTIDGMDGSDAWDMDDALAYGRGLLCGQLAVGFPMAVDGRVDKIVENLPVVRPTIMAAAPRIFEKVYNRIVSTAKTAGGLKYSLFKWAVGVGREVSRLRAFAAVHTHVTQELGPREHAWLLDLLEGRSGQGSAGRVA